MPIFRYQEILELSHASCTKVFQSQINLQVLFISERYKAEPSQPSTALSNAPLFTTYSPISTVTATTMSSPETILDIAGRIASTGKDLEEIGGKLSRLAKALEGEASKLADANAKAAKLADEAARASKCFSVDVAVGVRAGYGYPPRIVSMQRGNSLLDGKPMGGEKAASAVSSKAASASGTK